MRRRLMSLTFLIVAPLIVTSLACAQNTTQVTVAVGAEASITITTGTTTLSLSGGPFSSFTGSTAFSYKIRTSESGGSGSLTVVFGSDLTSGGNTISVGNLTYTCTDVAPASGTTLPATCGSSSTTASKSAATGVAGFGTAGHSADAGTSGNSVNWTLVNNPSYKTGSYSATATFTISAS